MRRRQLQQRPENFVLNNNHPLGRGLVFAGLGRSSKSTRYVDSSGRNNHGTLIGLPASAWFWSAALNRFALAGDNIASHYVTLPNWSVTNQMSLSVWVYANAAPGYDHIVSRHPGWFLAGDGGTAVRFAINTGTETTVSIIASVPYDQTLRHYAATYDGAYIRVYYQGVLVGTPTAKTGNIDVTGNTRLHMYWDGTATLDGGTSDPCVWARCLSAAEISSLADPSNVMLSGLILPPKRQLYPGITLTTPITTICSRTNKLFTSPIYQFF